MKTSSLEINSKIQESAKRILDELHNLNSLKVDEGKEGLKTESDIIDYFDQLKIEDSITGMNDLANWAKIREERYGKEDERFISNIESYQKTFSESYSADLKRMFDRINIWDDRLRIIMGDINGIHLRLSESWAKIPQGSSGNETKSDSVFPSIVITSKTNSNGKDQEKLIFDLQDRLELALKRERLITELVESARKALFQLKLELDDAMTKRENALKGYEIAKKRMETLADEVFQKDTLIHSFRVKEAEFEESLQRRNVHFYEGASINPDPPYLKFSCQALGEQITIEPLKIDLSYDFEEFGIYPVEKTQAETYTDLIEPSPLTLHKDTQTDEIEDVVKAPEVEKLDAEAQTETTGRNPFTLIRNSLMEEYQLRKDTSVGTDAIILSFDKLYQNTIESAPQIHKDNTLKTVVRETEYIERTFKPVLSRFIGQVLSVSPKTESESQAHLLRENREVYTARPHEAMQRSLPQDIISEDIPPNTARPRPPAGLPPTIPSRNRLDITKTDQQQRINPLPNRYKPDLKTVSAAPITDRKRLDMRERMKRIQAWRNGLFTDGYASFSSNRIYLSTIGGEFNGSKSIFQNQLHRPRIMGSLDPSDTLSLSVKPIK